MVRVEEHAARRRGGQIEELSDILRRLFKFFPVEPIAQMYDAGYVEGGNLGGKGRQPEIGIARISFAAAEGLQLAKAGTGVGPRQQLAVRVVTGPVQEYACQPSVGEGKISQQLADDVSHVEQHAATRASGNRRNQDDLQSRGEDFLPNMLAGGGDRFGRRHRGNRHFESVDHFRAVIDEGEAAQGAQPFRVVRFWNTPEPPPP